MSSIPKKTLSALFPQPVTCGPYTLGPATLLHLAALDLLGVRLSDRVGAHASVVGGFLLGHDAAGLRELMKMPVEEIRNAAFDWAEGHPPASLPDLSKAVAMCIDAAFATAVPGAQADPTPGQPQTSAGPSR